MKAYSVELRREIVEAVSSGTPRVEVAARAIGVGLSTAKCYANNSERAKGLAPRKARKADATAQNLLEHDPEERPSATLTQRRELLARVAGVEASDSTISRALRRMGFGRKKFAGSGRARRVFERGLEGDGRQGNRSEVSRVRGRVRREHLPGAAVRLVEARRAGACEGAAQLGKENVTLLSSLSSMSTERVWGLHSRSKGPPPAGYSKLTFKGSSSRRFRQGG
jgi:transposase